MSEIRQIPLSTFISLVATGKAFPSVEVLDNEGKYRFTAIVPSVEGGMIIYDDIRTSADYLGVRSNIPLAPSTYAIIDNVALSDTIAVVEPLMPKLVHRRRRRKRRLVSAGV